MYFLYLGRWRERESLHFDKETLIDDLLATRSVHDNSHSFFTPLTLPTFIFICETLIDLKDPRPPVKGPKAYFVPSWMQQTT